jgi:hypothetical protein
MQKSQTPKGKISGLQRGSAELETNRNLSRGCLSILKTINGNRQMYLPLKQIWRFKPQGLWGSKFNMGGNSKHINNNLIWTIDEITIVMEGPSWAWSYGSWIYNYLCNQCLSLLKLWVRISFMARCTWYNIMW